MFHPFYVVASDGDEQSLYSGHDETEDCTDDSSGKSTGIWTAASNLVGGDVLLMEDGQSVYVEEVRIEKLDESINKGVKSGSR